MPRPEPITIRETIHHGDYRNVREHTMEQTWQGFTAMLDESPYNAHEDPTGYARNPYVGKLFADLLTTGAGDHGWAHYEVVPDDTAVKSKERWSAYAAKFAAETISAEPIYVRPPTLGNLALVLRKCALPPRSAAELEKIREAFMAEYGNRYRELAGEI